MNREDRRRKRKKKAKAVLQQREKGTRSVGKGERGEEKEMAKYESKHKMQDLSSRQIATMREKMKEEVQRNMKKSRKKQDDEKRRVRERGK